MHPDPNNAAMARQSTLWPRDSFRTPAHPFITLLVTIINSFAVLDSYLLALYLPPLLSRGASCNSRTLPFLVDGQTSAKMMPEMYISPSLRAPSTVSQ